MALTQKQKIIGGIAALGGLVLLMGAQAQEEDGELPLPPEDEESTEEEEAEDAKEKEEEEGGPPKRLPIPTIVPDEDELPEDAIPPEPSPMDILDPLLSDEPRPGTLFVMKFGHYNFSTIVKKALNEVVPGSGESSSARLKLMKCMSMSPWNRKLYGVAGDWTNNFKAYTSPDDISIRQAWLNKSDNAVDKILSGQKPLGQGHGSSYGLLWIPLVNAEMLAGYDNPGCDSLVRQDGTSGLMPPQALLDLIGWS